MAEVFWSEKIEKKGHPLTFWVLLLTGSIHRVFFTSSSLGYRYVSCHQPQSN
jgi:hypothetical protein